MQECTPRTHIRAPGAKKTGGGGGWSGARVKSTTRTRTIQMHMTCGGDHDAASTVGRSPPNGHRSSSVLPEPSRAPIKVWSLVHLVRRDAWQPELQRRKRWRGRSKNVSVFLVFGSGDYVREGFHSMGHLSVMGNGTPRTLGASIKVGFGTGKGTVAAVFRVA
jgi:hypothetical protein